MAKRLPYGVYRLEIRQTDFADAFKRVEVRSALPTAYAIKLVLSPVNTSVKVSEANTLIDPDQAGSVNQIGSDLIRNRLELTSGPFLAGSGEFATGLAIRR